MQEELQSQYLEVALEALKQYDFVVESVEYLIEETNVFFLVHTKQDKVVLKIFQEESSWLEDNLVEAFLLTEIAQRTNLVVPAMIPSIDNEYIVFVDTPNMTHKRVAIYNYVEGEDLYNNETPELFFRLGAVTAQLHQAAYEMTIPDHLNPKKWDKVLYYRGETILYRNPEYGIYFSREDIAFLDRFFRYLDERLPEYYVGNEILMHADLNPWNVKLHNGDIRLLDFEEGLLGHPIHDIAIMLFYYRYDDSFDYQEVKQHYLNGYRSVAPLPPVDDFDIDLLIMARTANFVNYVLIIMDEPGEYVRSRVQRMRDFVASYDIPLKEEDE